MFSCNQEMVHGTFFIHLFCQEARNFIGISKTYAGIHTFTSELPVVGRARFWMGPAFLWQSALIKGLVAKRDE